MKDPTDSVVLFQSNSSSSVEEEAEFKKPRSLDETIEQYVGDFGFVQFLQVILVSFSWVFDSQVTFISVFTDAQPTWHCSGTSQLGSTNPCSSPVSSDICQLPKNSWAWDRPIQTSIISEWGLECASSVIKGLPASSFFMGCMIGGLFLATLADSSLGRKNLLFLSCLLMSFTGFFIAFSNNIWVYSVLKFVNGVGRSTIGSSALVLSTELVGKRWRGQVGVVGSVCAMLGFLTLPAIAYINRGSSWRTLYLWASIPTFFYSILVRFFVRESPRWLFVRGCKEEAVSIINSISPAKKTGLTLMSLSNLTTFDEQDQSKSSVDIYSAIKILLERKWARRRLSTLLFMVFGIGLVYYGMPLSLGNLSFNLYLSVTFNALSEIPATLITFFFIDKLNRRDSLLVFTILSGVCSIFCIFMDKISTNIEIGLELISYFSACTAFIIAHLYSIELFPTCVRSSVVSLARQSIVFGGVFSPALVAAGRKNGFLSYGIFGLVIVFCGLFVVFLPETRGKKLCDTMDEEEHKERFAPSNGPHEYQMTEAY